MDTILIAVTAVALAMTATMTVILVTVLRQERARSEARVAALSAMAADAIEDRPAPAFSHPEPPRRQAFAPRPAPASIPVPRFSEAPAVDDADDLEIQPAVAGVSHLFSEPEPSSPCLCRLGPSRPCRADGAHGLVTLHRTVNSRSLMLRPDCTASVQAHRADGR